MKNISDNDNDSSSDEEIKNLFDVNCDNDSSSDEEIKNLFDVNCTNDSPINEFIINCQCYSLPMFYNYDKYKKLENSDKILIPLHIMNNIKDKLNELKYPLIFSIEKIDDDGITLLDDIGMKKNIICQVYEFIEDIDDIYIPFRLMQNLWINEGSLINLRYCLKDYVKGEKIVLRPHTSDFLDIKDPKMFLEKGLIENYSVLSKEDIIGLSYFDNTLYFDVLETYPSETIIVNNTDLEVDFEKPLDYKEIIPEKKKDPIIENQIKKKELSDEKEQQSFIAFSGKGNRLGDK